MKRIRKILAGDFIEGERVVVNIDGNIVERVVYHSRYAGDLYIKYRSQMYFYSEFDY